MSKGDGVRTEERATEEPVKDDNKMANGYIRIPMLWAEPESKAAHSTGKISVSTDGERRQELLQEEAFHSMLALERRRAERSRDPFVLMLVDLGAPFKPDLAQRMMAQVASIILKTTRDTDLVGWYHKGHIVGAIFTELNPEYLETITEVLRSKIAGALRRQLSDEVYDNLGVSLHLYPQVSTNGDSEAPPDRRLYPDITKIQSSRRVSMLAKRAVDIIGSGASLLLFAPLLAAIAVAIKLTSKGPVIFRQERVGQFGQRFSCFKFRTMYADNDPKIHQEYVQGFIAGKANGHKSTNGQSFVYKLTNDPRVTGVGRFLRKTSLDELPQFWNVLTGEMSLVGPRPPVPYEFKVYDVWHRRRVLEVKPGVTGLWQVSGRSRTSFDDMVRLDLRYSQSWSLWLDVKILAATPRAVFGGEGAY